MAALFEPFDIRATTIRNRVMMSPMCQHSATCTGSATSWHLVHYGSRAVGGVGLVMIEDCGVEPGGRLSRQALGLYDDAHVDALKPIVDFCHAAGSTVGIQLSHAGRKAYGPDKGRGDAPLIAPSPIPFDDGFAVPREMSAEDCERVIRAFASAARRAGQAGFDLVEIHAAHGYLLHEFLSPVTNRRADEYGGPLENRVRFVHRVIDAVRGAWPDDRPVFVRISADDLAVGGLVTEDLIPIVAGFRELAVDVVDVSAGGLVASPIGAHTADQPRMAAEIRQHAALPTIAVGSIGTAADAQRFLADGAGDIVGVGRALLRNPYWTLEAARELGVDVPWPRQYALAKR